MLLPINIDVSPFMESFNVADEDLKQFTSDVISGVASDFHAHWEKAADVLGQTRKKYQESIYIKKIDDFNYEVGLVGWLPNAIEQGVNSFDQKEWFEKSTSKSRKENKDGDWYMTIPFRQGIDTTEGESTVFSGSMPSDVYKKAKLLKPKESLKAVNLPIEISEPKAKPRIGKSKIFEDYQRKHSIYEGIQRKQGDDGKGHYTSFRRVGENSDDGAWIHPGFEAKNFAEKAFETMNIDEIVNLMAEQFEEQL